MAMEKLHEGYTWQFSLADLERMDPTERRAAEIVAATELEVRAYLTTSIRDPDERQEAILDALAAAFDGTNRNSTSQSIRSLALTEARKRSAGCKRRKRHVDSRVDPNQWRAEAADDPVAVRSYRLQLWLWFEPMLGRLRQQERQALELYVAEGKSDRHIALELQCRPATVRKLRERAAVALRRAVEREEAPPPPEAP